MVLGRCEWDDECRETVGLVDERVREVRSVLR